MPSLYLRTDAFERSAIRRVESIVVAIGTAAARDRAVSVGAGKPGIYGDFLDALAEQPPEITGVTVEPSRIAPYIYFYLLYAP